MLKKHTMWHTLWIYLGNTLRVLLIEGASTSLLRTANQEVYVLTHSQNANGNMISWLCMLGNYWFERAVYVYPAVIRVGNKRRQKSTHTQSTPICSSQESCGFHLVENVWWLLLYICLWICSSTVYSGSEIIIMIPIMKDKLLLFLWPWINIAFLNSDHCDSCMWM